MGTSVECFANNSADKPDYLIGEKIMVARDKSGTLWLYPGNGAGKLIGRMSMGAGWNMFNAIVSPGDLTGDGNADVLARTASGDLRLYPGNDAGRFAARRPRQVQGVHHRLTVSPHGRAAPSRGRPVVVVGHRPR